MESIIGHVGGPRGLVVWRLQDYEEPPLSSRQISTFCVFDRSGIPAKVQVGHNDDFYPTPRHAIRSLIFRERFNGTVWEPCCGDGAIAKVLKDAAQLTGPIRWRGSVIATNLTDRGYGVTGIDFLTTDPKSVHTAPIDHIVTNPPHRRGVTEEFVDRALKLASRKVAMLLPLTFLEGKARRKLFYVSLPSVIYVFSDRVSFYSGERPQGAGRERSAFAWFVWHLGKRRDPRLK